MTKMINNPSSIKKPLPLSVYCSFVTLLMVGSVFLYSGIQKIFLPYEFLSIIYGYEIVGPNAGFVIVALLPWFELSIGFCLLSRTAIFSALFFAVILLACFVFARLSVLMRGLVIPCGCYGISEDVVNWQNTGITILLLILALIEFIKILPYYWNNRTTDLTNPINM